MRLLKRAIQVVILVAASNWFFESIIALIPLGISQESVLVGIAVLWAAFLWVNLWPLFGPWPTERVRQLSYGCELLTLFWISAAIDLVLVPVVTPAFFGDHPESTETFLWLIWLLFLVVMEAAVYWKRHDSGVRLLPPAGASAEDPYGPGRLDPHFQYLVFAEDHPHGIR